MADVVVNEPASPATPTPASVRQPIFSPTEYLVNEERKRQSPKIVELIERFYNQIRYGCTASRCTYPTCRSYRDQRTRGVPYRVPTSITSRAIAAYLVALDDPFPHLCTNTPAPKSNPFDLAFPTSQALYHLAETGGEGLNLEAIIANPLTTDLSGSAAWFAKAEFEEWMQNQALSNTSIQLEEPHPYKPENNIDTKAFAQRLFISVSWKLFPFLEAEREITRPEQLTHGSGSGRSPSQEVLKELINFDGTQQAKCLLLGGEHRSKFFSLAYHDENFLDTIGRMPDIWSTLMGENEPAKSTPMSELCSILTNPAKLMFYGLNPFPRHNLYERPDAFSEIHIQYPGMKFFHERCSQPLTVLYLEMANLGKTGNVDMECILEWLSTSVKCTALRSGLQEFIASPIAAHIVAIAIATLLATVFTRPRRTTFARWSVFETFRRKGYVMYDSFDRPKSRIPLKQAYLDHWATAYEEPASQYLMKLVLRSFASWSYATTCTFVATDSDDVDGQGTKEIGSEFKGRLLMFLSGSPSLFPELTKILNLGLLEWARTIFLKNWDGGSLFHWNTDVGASVEFMGWMHTHGDELAIQPSHFTIDILLDRMDYVEACKEWMDHEENSLTGHLFDFPWLFTESAKVTIFRAINLLRMFSAYESSVTTNELVRRLTGHIKPLARQLLDKLSTSMDNFLLLEIRRDDILQYAFNQLWRRQKRELFRPLKVRMGMDEGEEGIDMGGVQQEFFRLAIANALEPVNGLFTIDERTRMTWFQPMSLSPLYQYTLIGLLFGLALYNGITLTVTFPLAFYRKLLGMQNTDAEDIKDGWPDLHTGLKGLLEWSDGQVEDVFLRTYTFSFETHGIVRDVDMKRTGRKEVWPPEKDRSIDAEVQSKAGSSGTDLTPATTGYTEPEMVTNENRKQYVDDYIFWLTDKSIAPQFQAFASGFYLPLQRKAFRLFRPEELRLLLEGHQGIDIEGLKRTTRYEDGFQADHPRIKEFWEIVRDLSPDQHTNLLEFVTASPRVPVRGMEEVTFIIQRNGVGDERLPSSMTCFGRLLLPEYSSKEIMREKLKLAIENSIGFGTQ